MIDAFDYSCRSPAVLFGAGRALHLAESLEQMGVARVLLVTTGSGAQRYRGIGLALGARLAASFDGAVPHCPVEVAEAALHLFRLNDCDAVVTVGGGSTIGLGKYIAVHSGAPHMAIPTTLSGSEMTPLYGVLQAGEKRSRRDPKALAHTVVVDPELARSLPLRETATTGMNALAHCIEALYVRAANPVSSTLAIEGIAALFQALSTLAEDPASLAARSQAAYGATLGGLMVNNVGIGMHHRLCHVLGGRFGAPHGETNCVVLPYVLAFNLPALPSSTVEALQRVLGDDPALALYALARKLHAPASLQELDIDRGKLAQIAA